MLTTEEQQKLEKEKNKTRVDAFSSGSDEEENEKAPISEIPTTEISAKLMYVKMLHTCSILRNPKQTRRHCA